MAGHSLKRPRKNHIPPKKTNFPPNKPDISFSTQGYGTHPSHQQTFSSKVARSKSTRSYKEHATVPRVISSTSEWDLTQSPKFNYHSLKLANLVQSSETSQPPMYAKPGQTKNLSNSENGSSDSGMGFSGPQSNNSMTPEIDRQNGKVVEVSVTICL